MERISDEEIAENAIVCWAALEEHERRSFQLVAQAQLEACQKEEKRLLKIIEWLRDKEITPEEASLLISLLAEYGNSCCDLDTALYWKLKPIANKGIIKNG